MFTLFGPEMLADPYPVYRRLRADQPVCWHEPFGAWVLTRYDDVAAALHDPRLASERAGSFDKAIADPAMRPLAAFFGDQMNFVDPPRHARLRGLVHKAFTPHAVAAMEPAIQELVDRALDRAAGSGRLDMIADLAFPLPATVIARLLGLPDGDLPQLKRWSDDIAAVFGTDPSQVPQETYRRAFDVYRELADYFGAALARVRARPGSDLLSALAAAEIDGQPLSEAELLANANLFLNAGHETTTNLIGNGVLALLRHPDQLDRLRAEPALIPSAVEEFLRYESPVQFMTRLAKADVLMRGQTIRQGQLVYTVFGAANRDPDQFPDPDQLDIARHPNKHLAFGHGHHFCLGAPLARLEAAVAFRTLLQRFPKWRLESAQVEYQENFELRGVKSLVVGLG